MLRLKKYKKRKERIKRQKGEKILKKNKIVGGLITVLFLVPFGVLYSALCGKNSAIGHVVYMNWILIILQNLLLYYLCRWERRQSLSVSGISASNKVMKINIFFKRWHLKNIFLANLSVAFIGSFYLRAAILIVGLKEKPFKFIPAIIIAVYGKGYTEFFLGNILARMASWFWGLINMVSQQLSWPLVK
ncbi:hypothetical protein A3B87_03275 [Candidatus Kuenenbacteria bacterium RIFCSPHIGHO2_02_FULL_39_13]|uniref:Uncharacterized protein n=1 Tax=Candidatus Kuenenbacteria bacterium RIFCSPHIGHO2_02_FULL_39_13 TaxID=1798561 RepID=A0A1F6FL74_9BACT|nr:MAG: hypothetical protein A3B87_03275 [Candidatus Kuenenbacteria bacterium RIFCSPHIGHO2_02_FULL_39_13]